MLATAAWVGRKWGALSRAQASQAALAQVQTLAAELPREDQLAGLAASIEAAVAAETKAAKAKGADREAARVEADKVIGSAASVGPEVATLLADARAPLAGLQATLQTHPRQVVQGAARILDALLRASALSTAAHALSHTRPADARGYRPSIAEDEAVQLITDMFGVLVDAHFYAVVAAREAAEAAEASTSAPASNPGGDAVDQAAEHHAAFDPEHATPSSADQAMANYVLDALSHFPGTTHALLSLISPHRAVYTRLSSFRLFARMLHARGAAVRSHVLTAPGGCGEVVEHLILAISHGADASAPTEEEEDSNPLSNAVAPADVLIRAVTLTLLPSLVSGSAEIAKLVAFGGSFEALLDVIARAGRVEGGQLTYLALAAMLALLQGDAASSNGTYFRETGGIVLLPPLLFFPSAAAMADPQRLDAFAFQPWPETPRLRERKVNNVALVLSIADALTRPEADSTGTTAAALVSGGMVACVANIACASTAPTCVRTMALKTLAKLVENDHTRAALATGRGATLYMKDALYDTLVAPILPAPPEGAIRTPPRPVPAVLVDLALAGDPLSRTWAGENKFTEALPVLRAEAAAEASTADEADVLGMQRAHEQAELTARLADRPLRDAASQVIAAFVSTASAKQAVLHALLPPPIELVQPPEPPPADLPGPQGAEAMGAEATTRPQSPRPMAIISPERAKAELLAGPLLGALVGPPPHEILAENDFAVSAAATSAAALFADLLSPPAGAPLDAAVESVTKAKETALEVSFDLNGQVCIRPLLHTEELASETDGEYDLDSEDDDVDPREPLFQVVLARATRCLAHISAVPAAIVLDSPDASGRETAGLTAEGLLSLLSFWVWGCPAAASTFLRESENLHALLPWRKRLSAAQAAQATTGPMAGQARLAGVASFLLAAVYQFNTATHGLTRKTLQPLLASDPVTVEEASWLIRNLVVRPPTKSDVEGQNDSSALPLYAQRSFLQFYQQTHLVAETALLIPDRLSTEYAPGCQSEQSICALQTSLTAALTRVKNEETKESRAAQRISSAIEEAEKAHRQSLEAYDQVEHNAGRAIAELRMARDASQRTLRILEKRSRKAARADARARQAQIQSETRTAALEQAAKEQHALEVHNWSIDQLLVPPNSDTPPARLTHLVAALQTRVDALPDIPLDQLPRLAASAPASDLTPAKVPFSYSSEPVGKGDTIHAVPQSTATMTETSPDLAQRFRAIQQENEDLLVLLEDLTQKRRAGKAVLRAHGQAVSENDDDDVDGGSGDDKKDDNYGEGNGDHAVHERQH